MFVLCYFRSGVESLHLALSDDGLVWQPLNQNQPVWSNPIGAKMVRDPFVLRDQNGQFHLLATCGWGQQEHEEQNKTILHAISDDLISWRDPHLVPVMSGIEGVRNCWAPEAFWDEEEKCYRLIWSSSTTVPNGRADWNHRIWSCSTRDFREFSAPSLFFDPGHSVIDATVVRHEEKYLMAYKDERGDNVADCPWKSILTCWAPSARGPWSETSEFLTPHLTEGPALFWREDAELGAGWTLIFDQFIALGFGALHSRDGRTWTDISSRVQFPTGTRHAGVLSISDEEAARLKSHFASSVMSE